MKSIILIGDSIRMGYDKYIEKSLAGVAKVYYPEENCRFASYVLRYLHEWKSNGGWPNDADLVHWNAGLWDVLELFGDGPITTKDAYADAISRIEKRIRLLFPNAKQVFATSTTVDEAGYGESFKRHNSIIREYNAIAKKVLSSRDVVINDLEALTESLTPDCRSDMTHFYTEKGTEAVGGRVLSVICDELDIEHKSSKKERQTVTEFARDDVGY